MKPPTNTPRENPTGWVCSSCRHRIIPQTKNRGSGAAWILTTFGGIGGYLYLHTGIGTVLFILGIILLIQRASDTYRICPTCHQESVIPATSPAGQEIFHQGEN